MSSTSAAKNNVWLLAFLGNPGKKYATTRHNAGFMLADFFYNQHKDTFQPWKESKKYSTEISRGTLDNKEMLLLKPLTYMNDSGRAIQLLVAHFCHSRPLRAPSAKAASATCDQSAGEASEGGITTLQLIVISDDINFPFGRIRIRSRGSAGGHNGLKSVISHLNTNAFLRLRIGIANENRKKIPAEKYVLQRFSKNELKALKETILPAASEALAIIIAEGIEKAQQKYNASS